MNEETKKVSPEAMLRFWKTKDGRWRQLLVAFILLLLVSAVYDFAKEGWGSLSGTED